MTRAEYDAAKAELLTERKDIDRRLNELRDSYTGEELAEYRAMYEGKYLLFHARVATMMGRGPIIPDTYTVHAIDKVDFVGTGFIRYTGTRYSINANPKSLELHADTHDEFSLDLTLRIGTSPDKIITREEFNTLITTLRDRVLEQCDSITNKDI